MTKHRGIKMQVFWSMFMWTVYNLKVCDANEPISISQISPKSIDPGEFSNQTENISTSEISSQKSILLDDRIDDFIDSSSIQPELRSSDLGEHSRIQRSASPILNEQPSKANLDFNSLNDLDTNDVENSGKYFNHISPTSTISDKLESGEFTKSEHLEKDISNNYFLSKRGPRQHHMSGSPIIPTSVTLITPIATASNISHPRQNPNPDIQDIITGIVKLLNGNVNVHANTQTHRRPIPSRINNRGPPKISEAQLVPIDYEFQKPTASTARPVLPPYPFERPEVRPYLAGVPIPEQIVPSMQQNQRPGFISQNRPPWHWSRPRQPVTGNRRPVTSFKPIPSLHEYQNENDGQIITDENETNETFENYPNNQISEDINQESIEDIDLKNKTTEFDSSNISNSSDNFMKKEDPIKKKDTKHKNVEKKTFTTTSSVEVESVAPIIESTSETNTEKFITTTKLGFFDSPVTVSSIQSSIEEPKLSISPTETPTLTVIQTSKMSVITTSAESITTTKSSIMLSSTNIANQTHLIPTSVSEGGSSSYHPRPGIVLDDPEFKPGGGLLHASGRPQRPHVQPTRVQPPGYGEIFDVTLSAIQGPGSVGGSKHTINIKPFGNSGHADDIIISPSNEEGFVSIDGKRTYINLFGDATETKQSKQTILPTTTQLQSTLGLTGTAIVVSETEKISQPTKTTKPTIGQATTIPTLRPHYRPRTTQPQVRIDTCIVGDDTTCDQAQNEKCKTENGISSCHCRPGYSRRKHREPCRRVVSFFLSLRVDKIYERRIIWDKLLLDHRSDSFIQLSFESIRAMDSAMSMTPFSDEFIDAKVNNIYKGESDEGMDAVFVNMTIQLEENAETLRPSLKNDIQKHLLGVLHRRNNNIGNSILYVKSPVGAISNLQDLDECQSKDLNDCHTNALCKNIWGSFRCQCEKGFRDLWSDQVQRAGRECQACPESYCNSRGICSYDENAIQICTCDSSYYGSQCEIDGEVLGVAIGASVAAIIIIALTLVCLIMWSRRWNREQKNAIGSPVFGYMTTASAKNATLGQNPYQLTLEDRMRWAQIADVMAQANHYGAEPVASTRPSSAIFGYPSLQAMNMGTLGGISMAGTLPMHSTIVPPIPLPRLGLSSRSSGMRTLENSSSSEEEDRTDLLGRNFQVPRPKSRSSNSIANQSGIYYDVEYEPSGGDLYGVTSTSISNPIPGPQGIPMSTYTSGRAPSSYYMK